MSFSEYYRENMAAMGLPTPDGIYSASVARVSRVPCLKARTRCLKFYHLVRDWRHTHTHRIIMPV